MAFLKSSLLVLLASSLPAIALAGPGAAMRARAERMRARGEQTANSTLVARQFTSNAPYFYSGPYTSFPAMSTWVDFSTMVGLTSCCSFPQYGSVLSSSNGIVMDIYNHHDGS